MATQAGGGEAGSPGGLFAALRNSAATLLVAARTRIELAGNELATERIRLVRMTLLAVGALFCLGLGILLLFALVVALNWEQRTMILGLGAAFFLIGGGLLLFAALRANDRRQAFAATLAELEEDVRQLRAMAADGKKSD